MELASETPCIVMTASNWFSSRRISLLESVCLLLQFHLFLNALRGDN